MDSERDTLRRSSTGSLESDPSRELLAEVSCIEQKGAACAAPVLPPQSNYIPDWPESFSTTSLFSTLKAPKSWLARMPATSLSMELITEP